MNAKFGITGADFSLVGNHEKSVHYRSSVHPCQDTPSKPSIDVGVTASGDTAKPAARELTPADREHRRGVRDYVLKDAEPWHREHLGRLYNDWDTSNQRYFNGELEVPYILLSEPCAPQVYGDCSSVSGFGGKSQIRIRPSLLVGTHPEVVAGSRAAEGRYRFVTDVLLHEMIHQYQQEISGETDPSYHGHGPAFRDQCNCIGALLGLPSVRTCKKRGADANLPSCSQWPHNVRPHDYYLGALARRQRHQRESTTVTLPLDVDGAVRVLLASFTVEDLQRITDDIERVTASGDNVIELYLRDQREEPA
jgi:hypothetical protein